jgi:DNA repair protein RecO (recombination protein O)
MIEKTNAVVLRTTKYSESSIILKAFTEKFGMRSYLIRGVRKRNSKYSMNFFQALNILEMLVYERENRNLQNIKEIKLQISLTSHSFDIRKTAIAKFLK